MKKEKYFSLSVFFVALIVGLSVIGFTTVIDQRRQHKALLQLMTNQSKQMQGSVTQALRQVYGLEALILGANGAEIDLDLIGPYLVHEDEIRNVLLAPGGVVEQVYPLKGNEGVLGLDLYSPDNASYKEAILAKNTGQLVITGPYDLVQGGQAISGRIEVYLPQADGSKKDWGMASATLKFPDVMKSSATDYLDQSGYHYRVYKLNSLMAVDADPVLQNGFTANKDFETVFFSIQNMRFRIDAYPKQGWISPVSLLLQILAVFLISAGASALLSFVVESRRILQEKATKDSLTGLLNRDSGTKQIEKRMRSPAFCQGVFLLLDIDHFKQVNDTLGHQKGDQILIETGTFLKSVCRSDDIVCRLGGDEFVLFLPCAEPFAFVSNKLNQILTGMQKELMADGQTVAISASIGAAIAPADGKSFAELYKAADQALYLSKSRGRNCCSYYSETRTGQTER